MAARKTAKEDLAWLAWHTALIPRMSPVPKLSDLVGEAKPERKPMTPAEIDVVMRKWRYVQAVAEAQGPPVRPSLKRQERR